MLEHEIYTLNFSIWIQLNEIRCFEFYLFGEVLSLLFCSNCSLKHVLTNCNKLFYFELFCCLFISKPLLSLSEIRLIFFLVFNKKSPFSTSRLADGIQASGQQTVSRDWIKEWKWPFYSSHSPLFNKCRITGIGGFWEIWLWSFENPNSSHKRPHSEVFISEFEFSLDLFSLSMNRSASCKQLFYRKTLLESTFYSKANLLSTPFEKKVFFV